jgi:hypothetical protein
MTNIKTHKQINRVPQRRLRRNMLAILAGLAALFLAQGQRSASADGVSTTITVDTSSLGQSGPSEVFFVLTDGSAPTPGTNSATLSDFSFGAGGAGGAVDAGNTFGDVIAGLNLADGATIFDDQFTNVFAGFFTAGDLLSFDLSLSANVVNGASAPDEFALFIVDPNGNPLASSDPSGSGSLLTITIDTANPGVETYSDLVTASANGIAAPEPGTLLLLGAGLAAAAFGMRRNRRASKPFAAA